MDWFLVVVIFVIIIVIISIVIWLAIREGKIALDCSETDYYQTPGEAIADGYSVDEILTLSPNNELLFVRPPRVLCRPGTNQEIVIQFPQWCDFAGSDGRFLGNVPVVTGISGVPASAEYIKEDGETITSSSSCLPTGTPIIRWDPEIAQLSS